MAMGVLNRGRMRPRPCLHGRDGAASAAQRLPPGQAVLRVHGHRGGWFVVSAPARTARAHRKVRSAAPRSSAKARHGAVMNFSDLNVVDLRLLAWGSAA